MHCSVYLCQTCYFYVFVIKFFRKIITNVALLIFYRIYGNLAFAFLPMFQIIHARVLRWFCVSNYEYVIVSNVCIYIISQVFHNTFNIKMSILKLIHTELIWQSIENAVCQNQCSTNHLVLQICIQYFHINWNDSTFQCSQRWDRHNANLRTVHQNYKEMITQMFYVV